MDKISDKKSFSGHNIYLYKPQIPQHQTNLICISFSDFIHSLSPSPHSCYCPFLLHFAGSVAFLLLLTRHHSLFFWRVALQNTYFVHFLSPLQHIINHFCVKNYSNNLVSLFHLQFIDLISYVTISTPCYVLHTYWLFWWIY